MRDPQSNLNIKDNLVIRNLLTLLPENHPLKSKNAQKWIESGIIIQFKWINSLCLESPKIQFVTSPEEWCDAQLLSAARLTLDLLEKVNETGADLKDASAWNVIFVGCKPIFCDLTSLELIQSNHWWAAGQFVRHFISPLWLSRETGLQSRDLFRMSRDGAMPELVRNTLGWRRFLSRCWPLVLDSKIKFSDNTSKNVTQKTQGYRKSLVASLRWMLEGVQPRESRNTTWGQYTVKRNHYTSPALILKRAMVSQWLEMLRPDWILDLGCNNGEFSQIGLQSGAHVISLDGDHDAIQDMYLQNLAQSRLYPVLASLDDIHTGRGWAGVEHSGLANRLKQSADLVLMLALIHHLSIAAAVHLSEVGLFAAACTRRWLVVELLETTDPQLQLLCLQRRRNVNEFSVQKQKQAFIDAGFVIRQEVNLPDGQRSLVLMEKNKFCN